MIRLVHIILKEQRVLLSSEMGRFDSPRRCQHSFYFYSILSYLVSISEVYPNNLRPTHYMAPLDNS